MTTLVYLDVAIGVIYVFLAFSLIATALQEAIAGLLNWRAAALKTSVRQLMGERFDDFWTSPLIDNLKGPSFVWTHGASKRRDPSYIDPIHFSRAVLDTLGLGGKSPAEIRSLLETRQDHLSRWVLSAARGAGDQLEDIEAAIGEYFDQVMDRVKGWYVRRTKLSLGLIGFALAMSTNFNIFTYTSDLFRDGEIRAAVSAAAENIATVADVQDLEDVFAVKEAPPVDAAEVVTFEDVSAMFARSVRRVNELRADEDATGWDCQEYGSSTGCFLAEVVKGSTVLAWVLMALAVTLGAQFWFDLLKRILSVRSAGVRLLPGKNQSKPTS